MPSKLNNILTRMADIEVGIVNSDPDVPIPVVLQAMPYQPSDVSSVSAPFWINEIHKGRSRLPVAAGQQYRWHNFAAMLCLQRKEANIDLLYGIEITANWLDAVYETFAQHVRLSAPAKTILSSTNANPIVITTATPHRFETGDPVTVADVEVNTAANGAWIVTALDAYTFSIPTAGNGVGGQTGTVRLTQPFDMGNIVQAEIVDYDIVPYPYGSVDWLAIMFVLEVTEMYVTTIRE